MPQVSSILRDDENQMRRWPAGLRAWRGI